MSNTTKTLYQIADVEIRICIDAYLELAKASAGLTQIKPDYLPDDRTVNILLAGYGVGKPSTAPEQACEEWKRRQAVPFDVEAAITYSVYQNIRRRSGEFLNSVEAATSGFTSFSADYIRENPHILPILQHIGGVFSKSALKKQVGSVSDTSISRPASERLAKLLTERVDPKSVNKGEILQRLESTLEGIVRDLVGRVLLESIVDRAYPSSVKTSTSH